jgi:IclR family acetate operon transcriptional repressor
MRTDPSEAPASSTSQKTAAGERSYSVRAVERVCAILDLLQQSNTGVTLGQVAEATSLPKTSAFRYLWTLEQHRYIERDDTGGTFRLGTGIIGMASLKLDILTERAKVWLDEVRDELEETVNLGVLEGHKVVYLAVSESTRSVRLAARVGDLESIHSTALGKALAADMPDETVRRILEQQGMPRHTPNTLTSPEDYLEELHRVRRLNYAVDNGENEIDGRCVAVTIRNIPLKAAVSLSAPSSRFPSGQVKPVADRLQILAQRIEHEFSAH